MYTKNHNMDAQGFLTKWTIIGFLIGAAYFSYHRPAAETEEAQPEETEQGKSYRAARKQVLENRDREQLEWQLNHPQEYYSTKKFQSHETISHGTERVPHVSTPDSGNKQTRRTGRENSQFQPVGIQGPQKRGRNLDNAQEVRPRRLPWHFRDLQQIRFDRIKFALHQNQPVMKNKKIVTLQPPGHWKGNRLHTRNNIIEFKNLTEQQKAQALQDLKNGRLKIKKAE